MRPPFGTVMETFVGNELIRLCVGENRNVRLLYYRTQRKEEVDFILERPDETIVGVEVKAAATVGESDFRGIDALRRDAGSRLVRGIILYTGEETAAFGEDRFAVPLSALWSDPI